MASSLVPLSRSPNGGGRSIICKGQLPYLPLFYILTALPARPVGCIQEGSLPCPPMRDIRLLTISLKTPSSLLYKTGRRADISALI